jgi:hypothetical protein
MSLTSEQAKALATRSRMPLEVVDAAKQMYIKGASDAEVHERFPDWAAGTFRNRRRGWQAEIDAGKRLEAAQFADIPVVRKPARLQVLWDACRFALRQLWLLEEQSEVIDGRTGEVKRIPIDARLAKPYLSEIRSLMREIDATTGQRPGPVDGLDENWTLAVLGLERTTDSANERSEVTARHVRRLHGEGVNYGQMDADYEGRVAEWRQAREQEEREKAEKAARLVADCEQLVEESVKKEMAHRQKWGKPMDWAAIKGEVRDEFRYVHEASDEVMARVEAWFEAHPLKVTPAGSKPELVSPPSQVNGYSPRRGQLDLEKMRKEMAALGIGEDLDWDGLDEHLNGGAGDRVAAEPDGKGQDVELWRVNPRPVEVAEPEAEQVSEPNADSEPVSEVMVSPEIEQGARELATQVWSSGLMPRPPASPEADQHLAHAQERLWVKIGDGCLLRGEVDPRPLEVTRIPN